MPCRFRSHTAPVFTAFIALLLLGGLAPTRADAHALAISPDGRRLYVAGPLGDINVIDTDANAVSTTLPVRAVAESGGDPASLAVSPDGKLLYAASTFGTTSLQTLDLAAGKLAARTLVGPRDSMHSDLTVSPDGSRLYLVAGDWARHSSLLAVIGAASQKILATVPVTGVREALTPDGKKLYTTGGYYVGADGGVVSVVDTSTHRVTGSVRARDVAVGIAAGPYSSRIYVTHLNPPGATVDVINTISDMIYDAPYAVPGGESIAPVVSPDGKRLYVVVLPWNIVGVVGTMDGGVLGAVSVGERPIDQVLSPSGDRLYVLNGQRNGGVLGSVTVLDASTLRVVATIPLEHTVSGGG